MPNTSLLPAESMDCPAPLAWQDVVASWREESEPFETDGCHGPVRGRTLGRGPALYFANPLLGRCELFALLAWLLRDEFRCVLFDDSTLQNPRTPRLRGSVVDMVDDLLAVAAFHQDSRFSVVGSGLGSVVGLSARSRTPDRVQALILQGLGLAGRLSRPERWLSWLGSRLPGRLAQVPGFRSLLVHNHHPWFPPLDPSRLAFAIDTIGRLPLRVAARRALRFDRLDLGPCLDKIQEQAPSSGDILLVVPESHENTLATSASRLSRSWPELQVEPLAGCGPLACLTHPHRLATLIRTFLTETPPET